MEPNDIPIVSGASGAGGGEGTPPASVDALRQFADQVEGNVDRLTRELAEATRSAAAAAEELSDTALGQTFVDIQNRAVDAAKRVQKGADVIFREARDRAADAEARAHGAIAAVGGTPLVMTDEAYAVNQAGSHAGEAIERIIIPAISQQATEGDELKELPVGPPDPPIPIPGLPADPVPFNPPPDPLEPEPPPNPFVPPPPPADGGVCCPPQQIIVPAPVVNVVVDWSKMSPSYPPSVPPPPPPPPPPGVPPPPPKPSPDPLAPTVPQPPPPPAGVVLPPIPDTPTLDPLGVYDGPEVCAKLFAGVKGLNEGGGALGSIPELIFRAIGNSQLGSQPVFGPLVQAAASAVGGAISGVAGYVESILPQAGLPNPKAALSHIAIVSGANILDRYLGTDSSYYLQAVEQAGRSANPLIPVSQGDIDRMYLTARISIQQWECMTRLHGHMPWQHEEAMKSAQARLSLGELIQSARRGLISLDTYMSEARALGYLDDRYPRFAFALSEYVPSTPDLFRWIAKDVFRDDFAEKYGLDEDFPDDLPPAFQRWFAANGTSQDQIKYDYRAQWRLPSTTQLGEMVARLRPGRVPQNQQMTEADVDQLLKLDEWPARLRGQILATLYLPVNRTDLIEAYKAGTVDDAELVERLKDLRYNPTDAAFLADMIRAKAKGQMQSSIGAWTRRRIVKEYVGGTITRDVADRLLSRTVISVAERVAALDDADLIAEANRRRSCIKGIRRRYFTGELDSGQARAELTAQGVGLTVAAELLAGWTCERKSRSKEPTVKQLTEWVTLGIITVDEFRRRLENLGYTADDAQRIIIAADAALRQKQAKGRK